MDRRIMYKLNLKTDATQNRRAISHKQRADNRSKAFLTGRNLDSSSSASIQYSSKITKVLTDNSNRIITKNDKIEQEKRKAYIEKYLKWKKEKLEKEEQLQKSKTKTPKPFISTVRPGSNFSGLAKTDSSMNFKPPAIKCTKKNSNSEQLIGCHQTKVPDKDNKQIPKKFNKKITAIVNPMQQKPQQRQANTQKSAMNTTFDKDTKNNENNLKPPAASYSFLTSTSRKTVTTANSKQEKFLSDEDEIISPIEKSTENIMKVIDQQPRQEDIKEKTESNNENNAKEDDEEAKETEEIQQIRCKIEHFNNVLNQEIHKLTEKCKKWESYQKENLETIKELGNDVINVAIGQTKLLLNKKCEHFKELIERCETFTIPKLKNKIKASNGNDEECLILPKDLEGFWSIIELQIIDLNNRFLSLDQWKSHNWNDPDDVKENVEYGNKKKKTLSKNLKRKQIKPKQPSRVIAEMLKKAQAEYTKKRGENDTNFDENVIFVSYRHRAERNESELPSVIPSTQLTPLRRSIRLSNKKEKRSSLTPRLSNSKQTRLQKIVQQQQQRRHSSTPKQSTRKRQSNHVKRNESATSARESKIENDEQQKSNSSSSVSSSYMTPTKQQEVNADTSTPSNYLSPFVSTSRGKVSAKKEKEKRDSLYKLEITSPEDPVKVRQIKEAIKYFRGLLTQENQRLTGECNKWEAYQSDMNCKRAQTHAENCNEMINATIGQTKLLLNKKMKQFSDLIGECELCIPRIVNTELNKAPTSQRLILAEDLEGFWSMVCLQIENVDKRFSNLEQWKLNDWNDPEEVQNNADQKKKTLSINLKRKLIKPKQPSKAISEMLKQAQAEYTKKRRENNTNLDEDVIFVTHNVKNKQNTNEIPSVLPLTPLRRSNRLMTSKTNLISSNRSSTPRLSTAKQTRLQKIAQQSSRSRSNTPKSGNSTIIDLSVSSKRASKTIKTKSIDNTLSVKKSILKPPNTMSTAKRRVMFSQQLTIQNDFDNEMSGIGILNNSNSEYKFNE